jgi:hydrogenase maturation protein HypF
MSQSRSGRGIYEWQSLKQEGQSVLLTSDIIRGVVEDLLRGEKRGIISRRFHSTLIHMFSRMTLEIRDETGINTVVMSGGSFQNVTLLSGLSDLLLSEGFKIFRHAGVPTNDGGLSLGQAVSVGASLNGFEGEFGEEGSM